MSTSLLELAPLLNSEPLIPLNKVVINGAEIKVTWIKHPALQQKCTKLKDARERICKIRRMQAIKQKKLKKIRHYL